MPEIVSRKEALEKGLDHYFTGRPCKHGHIANRTTRNGYCCECNREKASEWRENNRETHRTAARAYYWDNSAKVKKREAERYKRLSVENPEKLRSQRYAWNAANPEKLKASQHKRRAMLSNSNGTYTKEEVDTIYKLQKGRCAYCKVRLNGRYQIDHIKPLCDGGRNVAKNIQLLCKIKASGGCNQRKGGKDPIDFAQSLGWLL